MEYIPNIIFAILLITGIAFFTKNVKKLIRNIKLGKSVDTSDHTSQRWKNMIAIIATVMMTIFQFMFSAPHDGCLR